MNHRIIKASVKRNIQDAVNRNRVHFVLDPGFVHQPESYKRWQNDKYYYPITIPDGTQFVVEIAGERVLTDMSTLPDCCYDALLSQQAVYDVITKEREHQDRKWGENKPQSLPGFFVILEAELAEAKAGWLKNVTGKHAPLNELVQLAATAVACLEKYGVEGSAVSTNDIPDHQS